MKTLRPKSKLIDMNKRSRLTNAFIVAALIAVLVATSKQMNADTGTCGEQMIALPFNDVAGSIFFCTIAEAYFSGLTNGTSSTTFSPSSPVTRDQMSAFVSRTLDQSLRRGSERLALRQTWTTQGPQNLGLTDVGDGPLLVESDGAHLWVANTFASTVSRIRASDGRLLDTWTGATDAQGVLIAMGKVFITGETSPGSLYQIDPTDAPGVVTTLSSGLGARSSGISFDGQKIWTANVGIRGTGSVSIISLKPTSVTTVSFGFNQPIGILYDGANIWVSDTGDNTLKKLDSFGAILQSVTVGTGPEYPAFDGFNIWVPDGVTNSISVVRASTGTVIATLSGNGLNHPIQAAFDGERILVTNNSGNSVSLWKSTDLTPIGTFSTGANTFPIGACSDGLNFWITLPGSDRLARF